MAVNPSQEKRVGMAPAVAQPQTPARVAAPVAQRAPAAMPAPQAAVADQTTDGTNANLLLAGLYGLALCAVVYGILFMVERSLTTQVGFAARITSIFMKRGWVNYVETYFCCWAIFMLIAKFRLLNRQRACMQFDVLPSQIATHITADNVDGFRNHLSSLPCKPGESFLVTRVTRALDHFRARSSVEEVKSLVATSGDQDIQAAQASYTMLNFFAWAIPILGFIGTVQGIGSAVGGFSAAIEATQEISAIKDALKIVTGGLGTAFDTTLLALCMALFLVMIQRVLEKGEGDLLIAVDDYCAEHLIARLTDDSLTQPNKEQDTSKEWVRNAVKEAMAAQEAEFKTWTAKLEAAGNTVTQRVTEGWEAVHSKLKDAQEGQLDELRSVVGQMSEDRKEFAGQIKSISDQQVQQLTGAVSKMAETATTIQHGLTALQQKQVENFKDVVTTLKNDLQALQQEAHQRTKTDAEVLTRMAAGFSESLAKLQEQAAGAQVQLSRNLEVAAAQVTEKVVKAWEQIDDKLKASQASQLQDIQKILQAIAAEREEFAEEVKTVQQGQVTQFAGVLKSMEETAMRIQAEVARLQQEQTRGLKESVDKIKGDLEVIQKQTGAMQLESSRHFEKISEQVTQKVVEGWEEINKHLGETHKQQVADVQKLLAAVGEERKAFAADAKNLQEAQVRQLSETIANMERTASRVQEQMVQMQQQFTRTFGEASTKQATEIKAIQGEVHERVRTDAEAMRQMVTSFVESLNSMREQARASQQEMGESIRNTGPVLRDQMREMMREISDGFRQQLASLEQSRQATENGIREFMASLNQMRQTQAQATTETVNALKEAARELQRELAAGQQQPLQKIAEASQAVMEQARKVQGEMESATRSLADAARQIADASRQSQDGAVRSASEQLDKITRVGKELVDSLAAAQKKLGDQIDAQMRMSEGQAKLIEMQEMLSSNLKMLTTSDDFKKALAGIDQGLDMLNPILKELSARTGVALSKEPGSDGRNSGTVSRLWRRVTKKD